VVNFVTSSREFVNSKFDELNFSNDFFLVPTAQNPKSGKPTFAEIFEHLSFVVFTVYLQIVVVEIPLQFS
jgi:hypothetical protein